MGDIISIGLKLLNSLFKFLVPDKIKLSMEYDPKNYSIEFKNDTNRPIIIMEIKINGKNLLSDFSVIEIHRKFPFQINSGQKLTYNLIISKIVEHPMTCDFYVKRYISGIKLITFTL